MKNKLRVLLSAGIMLILIIAVLLSVNPFKKDIWGHITFVINAKINMRGYN